MANFQKGTFNTIANGSASIGGNFPVWSRVDKLYQGGGYLDLTKYSAGDVIPAGSMVVFAGPGKQVTVIKSVAYDATALYAVGDTCVNNNKAYVCKTAITTAEAWTASHWTEMTSSVNGLVFEDVCIPDGVTLATVAVVRAGRIYADRVEEGLPTGIEANLPMIEFVREA